MSFIFDFFKLGLFSSSRVRAEQEVLSPVVSPAPLSPCRKRKSATPSDIVPSIEVDEVAWAQTRPRAKKRKTARNNGRSGDLFEVCFDGRTSTYIKEEPMSVEPWIDSMEDSNRVVRGRDNGFENDQNNHETGSGSREAALSSDEYNEGHSLASEQNSGSYVAVESPESVGGASGYRDTPKHQLQQQQKEDIISMLSTPKTHLTPLKKRGSAQKPVDWSSPDSLAKEAVYRKEQIAEQTLGWLPEDAQLYRRIRLRPLQPSLPPAWKMDFPGFPQAIFTQREDLAFIKPKRLKEGGAPSFTGPYAFKKVFNSGLDVRCALDQQRPPEKYIKKSTEWFVRWTLEDAGLRKKRAYLPIIEIQAASKSEPVAETKRKLTQKMLDLKSQWSAALEDYGGLVVPPLYGIMISHSVVAFMAPLDSDTFGMQGQADKDKCRVLAILDWSQDGQDVWNALAVAILAIHCRNILLGFLEGKHLKGVEVHEDT